MAKLFLFLTIFLNFIFANSSLNIITPQEYDRQKAELGKMLFFDKMLSKDKNISCETCHNLYWNFSGTNTDLTKMDTPTILNSALNFLFFKDGKVDNIYKQVDISLTSKKELNTQKDILVNKMRSNPKYNALFYKIYQKLDYETIVDAFVNFEKSLITPNSKYDNYISGSSEIFSASEKKGYEIFSLVGCISCHDGINLGGNLIVQDSDGFKKVPMLRNISKTSPYFYDKRTSDLKEVLRIKNDKLISNLSEKELDNLYDFLLTLDGQAIYTKSDNAK
ncbi:c-type cytochrome [Campylobacter sp. RM12327]|uniref:cytochrome-c peroxidase n=1 Tax=Campylobacter sputorum TaxID=206 RepID=UPI000B77C164|nr:MULTISPECIES: cytochrome c peroxidase [Campylobacter]ASM39286.1 cytochrome c peroxidase [Campylobacter sputorum]MBE7358455.1 c-type cytochrome [Campylobacter sp. RM11302]MBF6669370.1 c-type cytochrome [Campylobacter sp. RM12327]MBF6674638.1 c-type cytochrome [Campylobacter sp. RM13538]MBF6676145.1 c-type cytochrome [Campylobacter sp. RM12321]